MGRSKFPGKPSKSINRKRISVLQLEDEAGANAAAAASASSSSAGEQQQQQQQQSSEQSAANTGLREKGNNCDNDEDDNAPTGGASTSSTGGAASGGDAAAGGGGGGGGGSSTNSNGVNGSKNNDNGHHKSATQNSAAQLNDDGGDGENKDNAADTAAGGDDDDDSGSETKRPTSSSNNGVTPVIAAALQRARKGGNKKFKNLNLARAEVMLPSTSKLKQQQQLQLNCPLSTSPATAPASPIGNIANPFAAIDARVNESGEDVAMNKLSEMPNEGVAEIAATTAATGSTLPSTTSSNSNQAATTAATGGAGGASVVPSSGMTTGTKQKKTVTFRNVLETSDDKSVVKRFYNPDNRMPIVSIMKKDSLNRPLTYSRNSECIVRPSILSKILNKNSNIDKLNSLKFRSAHVATSCETQIGSGTSANVFGSGLSRAFGAPLEDDDIEMGGVTFHRNKSQESQKNNDDDDVNIEDDEDAEEDPQENEDDNDDGSASEKSAETATEKDHVAGDDKQLVMDKHFILPKRTRSSRIIKPNKRLLDDGGIVSKKHPNEANSKTKTKNYFSLKDKPSISASSSSSTSSISTSTTVAFSSFGSLKLNSSFVMRKSRLQFQQIDQTGPFGGISVPAMSFGLSSPSATATSSTTTTTNNNPASVSCAVCATSLNTNEVPQSRKYGVLVCDVCRKFISKMTKKAVSISSSSAAQPVNQQQLQCKQTEGGASCCTINSAKSQLKNFKKLYKDRCTACWLKKCLRALQLPMAQKNRLTVILPPNMRNEAAAKDDTTVALLSAAPSSSSSSTTSTSIKWKSTTETSLNIKSNPLAENNVTFGSTPLLRPAILEKPLFLKDPKVSTTAEPVSPNAPTSSTSETTTAKSTTRHKSKQDKPTKDMDCEKPALSPTLKKVSTETVTAADLPKDEQLPATASSTSLPGTGQIETNEQAAPGDNLKRQRIDLKGPRVKHVCRSASIVLGQPLATFGEEEEEQQQQQQEEQAAVTPTLEASKPAPASASQMITDENDNCASCKTTTTPSETVTESKTNNKSLVNTQPEPGKKTTAKVTTRNAAAAAATSVTSVSTLGLIGNKKLNSNNTVSQSAANPPSRRSKEVTRQRTLISIDFWENYDPAEVCQTGFGLIVTETVAQRALCFLCGSTGLDPLIFCACCCEPYHQYCVQDEYNLKHSSFEDTTLMNSLLDTSVNPSTCAPSMNQLTQRLNWLCPRCTVCYTCNMSSGSKVKCQKCQKNYHATCLGTSKRLLGADRPLICVNCLKCKSCSTTKVSKFVGNLPMCTACFKLRKKGNYCPICQKCYDDNDFDLKMMECGDCNQWVHSKCEGLSDEQYNLLSTLPESIEFICKKCARRNESSHIKADEWRQAVMEEFKSSLYSVLKLLSKSRQACALLKLSPRKKLRCICGAAANGNINSSSSQGKLQPKALQFSGSDGESQNSDDVYEFKDQQISKSLNPHNHSSLSKSCSCLQPSITQSQSFSLVDIKQKIAGNTYVSLAEFNYDMSQVIQQSQCDELDIAYKELLSEQFPWFQNETKACTDALEEDMFESCGGGGNYDDLQEESPTVYVEHTVTQGAARSGVLDIPLDVDVDDLGSCGIKMRLDSRVCLFCRKSGEGLSGEEARLLYCGHDCWVHTNCAMWSAEVFEEIDGSLQNVHSAVARGRMIKCVVCGNRGATVGCNVRSCGEHYHYPCARSIDCAFLTDKTMYCPAHAKNGNALKANGSPSVTYESNFEVSRPVYVELDRKRKKLIEPAKVQFHIGSLEVRQLGSIVPRFSDSFEALIPINFLCSRLYWSSKEPWKIVEYTVRTTIQNSYSSTVIGLDVGRNFTVDHSHTNSNMMLAKIARWHNSLSRNDLLTDTDWAEFPNVPTDENTEEEPQQNADLLPPEIKDAIFEDLPHDLLDGISMLDIFMYEDLGDKGELFAMSEQSKDGTIAPSQSQTNNQTVPVSICDDDTRNSSSLGGNYWPASNPVEDAMLSAVRSSNQVQVLKTRAWPKLDGNSVAAIKRRKLSKNLAEGMLLSLSNQQRTKKEMATVAGVSRRQSTSETCTTETSSAATGSTAIRSSNKNFTWSAAKRYFEKSEPREETAKLRIMQMDGVDDSITEFRIVGGDGNLSTAQFTGQVKCERCQCTYRNYESFQRHLPTCEPMSTSESESEATNAPTVTHLSAESFNEALQKQALAAATLGNAGGINYLQTSYPQVQNLGTLGQFGLQGLQPLQLQPQSLGNGFFLSQANHNPAATTGNDDLQLYANSLQSLAANLGGGFALTQPTVAASAQPQLIAVSTNPDGTQQFIQLPHTSAAPQAATYQTLQATNTDKKIMLPLTTAAKPLKTVATKAGQQATAAAKQKQLKSAHQVKPIQAKLQPHPQPHPQQQQPITATATTTQLLGQSLLQPQLLFQSNAQAQAPQLILPQTQPQNIISFVTGDGSQAQPLQYISIPTTNDFKHQQATATPTFLTTAAPGAGATFLQTDASGNLMLTTAPANSGLQMLAAPMQAQPQVIGTLIQPQTLQLATAAGATAGDGSQGHTSGQQPLILGGTTAGGATGLEFATTTPQVILATQPMYYGLETIVQNTVMSSQQFVSTAMPGVLSQNASFSATTTQVFQASKIEPIVDLPAGYVVLNNPGADGTAGTFLNAASVLQQQQHQQQQHTQEEATTTTQLLQNANFQFQTVPTSATSTTSMADFATSSPLVVTAKIPPVTQMKRKAAATAVASGVSAAGSTSMPGLNKMMQPQVVNKVLPTSIATSHHAQVKQNNANLRQTVGGGASTLKTKHTPGSNCGAPPSIASKPLQKKTNLIRPIHKVEVKPKVMKPIPKLSNPVVGGATTLPAQSQQHPHPHTLPIVSQVVQQRLPQAMPQQQPSQQQTQQHQQQQQQQLPVISIPEPQQIQQMPQQQQSFSLETQEPATDMINRVQHFVSSSLPTNVVNPLQQQPATITTSSRPTNRVLPMQQRQEPPVPLINDPVVPSSPTPPKPTEQPIIVSSVSSGASKCYAPKASPSTVYETELKMTETEITQNHIVVPPSTITAINTMLEHPQEQIITETFYEKQPSVQQLPEDKCNELLLQAQQQPQTHLEIVDNGYLMEKHGFQMETEPLPMESNEHFTSLKEADDIERVVDEEDDDDDFSLKMATSACQDHEMSDCEEPAVKEKISKILDNLTNDDCADSIATATTAEVESSAGYQQMVEDVLATTAAAAASASSSASSTEAAAMPNDAFEATAEETAAVEAAASYINEMAEAHVLELKQLQNGVELELKTKEPPPPSKQTEQSQLNEQPTAAAPEPPPPIREPKKISGPHLLYEIQSEDGFTYKSSSIAEIWEKVFEAVQVARRAHGLTQLPEGPLADMGGIQMIGLKTNALKYLIEQLPGVEKCSKYTPKYHKRNGNVSTAASSGHLGSTGAGSTSSGIDNQPLLDYGSDQDDLQENAYDCARCEPYATRSEYDMFSWLASRHRKQPIQVFVQPSDNELVPRRGTGSNLPMAMKYRTLKETYKDYVGVFRSHIHGRGLYCTKDIEAGEMVIEYAGELIRSTLTDKRERYYDSRGIGCYMFKIDDNLVVDATMRGNAARFINHSCEPNCYSKVVDILGHKHIIIFALRRIVQGEELTYDYKFPFEEEKIPCSCGSKRCRKYLN